MKPTTITTTTDTSDYVATDTRRRSGTFIVQPTRIGPAIWLIGPWGASVLPIERFHHVIVFCAIHSRKLHHEAYAGCHSPSHPCVPDKSPWVKKLKQ